MSVTTDAIEGIKQMILSGRVGPGDKLPREKELAVSLGLSRSSLREAVRALAALKVLEVRQGDGTYITSLAPEMLLDVMGFGMELMNDPSPLEIFEVRRFLETAATAIATVRIRHDEVEALRHCMARMEAAKSVEELVRVDEEFHHIIATATRNSVLVALLNNLSSRTVRARIWRGVMENGVLEKTKQWHEAILRGIEVRDPEFARAADLMHILEGEVWLRRALGRESIDGEVSPSGLLTGVTKGHAKSWPRLEA